MNIIYFRIASTSLAIFLSYFSMWYVSVLWVNTVPSSERNISSVNDTAASTTTQTVLCTIVRTESSCTSDIKTGRWLCRSGKESRLVLPRLRGGGWASVRASGVGVSRITRQSYICVIYCTILSEIRNSELINNLKNQVLKKIRSITRFTANKNKFFCQWVEGEVCTKEKESGCRADHTLPCSSEVTNEWSYRPTPPYAFISCKQTTLLHILIFFKYCILFFSHINI